MDAPTSLAMLLEIAPIYLVAIATLAGDALGVCRFALPLWFAAMLAIAAAALYLRRAAPAATGVAMLAIVAAVSMSARDAVAPRFSSHSIRNFSEGAALTLEGRIERAPQRYPDREYVFVDVERAGRSVSTMRIANGTVRLTIVGAPAHVRVGDEVRVAGMLRFARNFGDPGEFDYATYLARQGIAATMVLNAQERARLAVIDYRREFPASWIAAARARIGAFIDANLAGRQRAEMRALMIGDRGGIGQALRQQFALTGLAHMLVISGLHLGFVAAAAFCLVRLLMTFFPALTARGYANKAAAIAAAIAASAYAAIAIPHVSTARALVMVLAYTMAIVADRARALLASLALAAIVICLVLPGSTADIGFQLSFVSVLAIALGMRRFAPWWERRFATGDAAEHRSGAQRGPGWMARVVAALAGYVAVSFWALIGVAPLTAYHFNQFSAVGVLANSVVVPIMAIGGVVGGLTACAIGMFAPALGAPLLIAAGWSLTAGTWLAGWFARWPWAYFRTFTPTPLEIAIAYGFLLLWLTAPVEHSAPGLPPQSSIRSSTRFPPRWRLTCCAILSLMLAGDAAWWAHDRWFNPDLRVTFLSVGEGDAAVVRFGGGRVMLIDAGGAWPGGFDFGERVVARYLWTKKIMRVDYLVVSHPDLDHFGGMAFIARNFSPREFWVTAAVKPEWMYTALMAEVAAEKIPLRVVDSSMRPLRLGGVSVRCLGPAPGEAESKDNNLSMVLRIGPDTQSGAAQSILFTGDIEAAGERDLLARTPAATLAATVLKAPHHGSRTSSSAAFVAAVRPRVVILSLGYRNRFGFPAPAVVERYVESGARVFRTDRSGAVSVDFSAEPGRRGFAVRAYNAISR